MNQQMIELRTAGEVAGVRCAPGVTAVEEHTWERQRPTLHLVMIAGEVCVARCSLWLERTPALNGKPVAVVGHYSAASDAGSKGAAATLLERACSIAAERGLMTVVGPMDGNTWRRYRLVTERGSEPPFFLEPDNPDDWPRHFEAAGFEALATYFSALSDDVSIRDPRVPQALQRLKAQGVRLRNIDLDRFDDELAAVHELSVEAFADNFLYTPIGRDEFLAMYRPLRSYIRPELVLLAERKGRLEGFMFGLPNMLEAQRGEPVRMAVAKSMAVRPGRGGAGLGSVLMNHFQAAAQACGYQRVIHALMHENNISRRISSRYGPSMRQYTLYSRTVA